MLLPLLASLGPPKFDTSGLFASVVGWFLGWAIALLGVSCSVLVGLLNLAGPVRIGAWIGIGLALVGGAVGFLLFHSGVAEADTLTGVAVATVLGVVLGVVGVIRSAEAPTKGSAPSSEGAGSGDSA